MTRLRILSLILAMLMVTVCLCGCSRIKDAIGKIMDNAANPLQEMAETFPTQDPEGTQPVVDEVLKTGFINCEFAYVYANAGEDQTQVGYLSYGDPVTIYETVTVGAILWGRTENGWICMDYVSETLETAVTQPPAETPESKMGITSGDYVNVRSGAGTQYEIIDNIRKNTRLEILEIRDNWCKTTIGWVYMDYVYIDGTYGTEPSIMGTVKGTDVNVRSGPGTDYEIIGSTNTGDRYEFFYQTTIGGRKWGCTSIGWICMDYVRLDGTPAPSNPGPTAP